MGSPSDGRSLNFSISDEELFDFAKYASRYVLFYTAFLQIKIAQSSLTLNWECNNYFLCLMAKSYFAKCEVKYFEVPLFCPILVSKWNWAQLAHSTMWSKIFWSSFLKYMISTIFINLGKISQFWRWISSSQFFLTNFIFLLFYYYLLIEIKRI